MSIAVLGAGVSGLTAARRLSDKGCNVTVYEINETPGGLARTRFTEGYLYDPHGGHILNSKKTEVMDWVFSILPKDNWQYTQRNAKIFFEGRFISYPFELSLHELPTEEAVNCVYDYILSGFGPEPENFRDWLIHQFGKSIADYYMLPYNQKIWAYPLENMGTSWMRGKMPLPDKKDVLRSFAAKDSKERNMPHSTFYYPIEGGIQSMVDAIANPLNIKVKTPVCSIEQIGGHWFINGEGPYNSVISTIPLKVLSAVMDLPGEINNAIAGLKYNSLTTMMFDCPKTDITWLYIPSSKYKSHRVGYQSALTPKAVPKVNSGLGALEIIGKPFDFDSSFIKNNPAIPLELKANRLIDSEFTEYAYVIHDLDYVKNTGIINGYFDKTQGFYTLGRWGRWNYNNMDLCMWEAFELTDKILKNI